MEGVVGPGMAFKAALKGAEITHTVVCGDNFMGSHTEEALSRIMDMLQDKPCDLFIAGPAFQAGRYGVACGNVCKAVKERLHIPVITSMNEENPGVEMFKRDVIIFKGGNGAVKMRQDVKAMASLTTEISRHIPSVPNTVNQITEKPAGRNITPFINSPMVRPREILAIKEPVKGAQAIHQAQ